MATEPINFKELLEEAPRGCLAHRGRAPGHDPGGRDEPDRRDAPGHE